MARYKTTALLTPDHSNQVRPARRIRKTISDGHPCRAVQLELFATALGLGPAGHSARRSSATGRDRQRRRATWRRALRWRGRTATTRRVARPPMHGLLRGDRAREPRLRLRRETRGERLERREVIGARGRGACDRGIARRARG